MIYCIGDIQGCYDELQLLLEKINFAPTKDELWLVGDLVNRGPKSLEVLRFVKQLPNKKVVLGNHDLHLLNFYNKVVDFECRYLEQIANAADGAELIDWLRHLPLLYYDAKRNYIMVHAGVYPSWDLATAIRLANEAETILRSDGHIEFLRHMYGDEPSTWSDDLTGWDRLRFIINAFTRMRFCYPDGKLDFSAVGTITSAPKGYLPWYQIPARKTKDIPILFGHWAALEGKVSEPNVFALDTGCVWGGSLTAMRLEDGAKFTVPC